jgi:CheY-like chemotaxis protein
MINDGHISVLYAEDNEDSGTMLTALLGYSDIKVAVKSSVRETVELDGGFPDGKGTDLCRTLRAMTPQKPVVFYSANAFDSHRESAMEAGAAAYIVKPDIDSVASTIIKIVGGGEEV